MADGLEANITRACILDGAIGVEVRMMCSLRMSGHGFILEEFIEKALSVAGHVRCGAAGEAAVTATTDDATAVVMSMRVEGTAFASKVLVLDESTGVPTVEATVAWTMVAAMDIGGGRKGRGRGAAIRLMGLLG